MLEEKKEEEKIANQLHELENQYKREIRGEQGLPPEDYSDPSERYSKVDKRVVSKRKDQPVDVEKETPQPIIREMESIKPAKVQKHYEFNPIKLEY